eukprot:g18199.t1
MQSTFPFPPAGGVFPGVGVPHMGTGLGPGVPPAGAGMQPGMGPGFFPAGQGQSGTFGGQGSGNPFLYTGPGGFHGPVGGPNVPNQNPQMMGGAPSSPGAANFDFGYGGTATQQIGGYRAESLPLPNVSQGMPATNGTVTRSRFVFTKVFFESSWKLQHPGQWVNDVYLLRPRDKLPDRPMPHQQSYNEFTEWLQAVESYLLKLVIKPMGSPAFLFPAELENEILEEMLYDVHPGGKEGTQSKASKFRCMPDGMRTKLRTMRFKRKNRLTLTFLNLTYRLYEEHPHNFLQNRSERDAFYDFERKSGEADLALINRYIQVSQEAQMELFPVVAMRMNQSTGVVEMDEQGLKQRQDVWEELGRKVELDQRKVKEMMFSPIFRSPEVPFIENYKAFLESEVTVTAFMNRRSSKSGNKTRAGANVEEQVFAAKANPKSNYKYDVANPAGRWGGGTRKGPPGPRGKGAGRKGKGDVRKRPGQNKTGGRGRRCRLCWGNHETKDCKYTEQVCRVCFKPGHFEASCPNKPPSSKVGNLLGNKSFQQKSTSDKIAAILEEMDVGQRERVMLVTVDNKDEESKFIIQDSTMTGVHEDERIFCVEVNDEHADECEIVMGVREDSEPEEPEDDEEEEAYAGGEEEEFNYEGDQSGDGGAEQVYLVGEVDSFLNEALTIGGYCTSSSALAEQENGQNFCAYETHQKAQLLLSEEQAFGGEDGTEELHGCSGSIEGTVSLNGERVLFTTESTQLQWDTGYNNQIYLCKKSVDVNRRRAEKFGLKVPSRRVNDSSSGIGNSKQVILGKVVLPYVVLRVDGAVYCFGFEEVTETKLGPNLGGEQWHDKNFCSVIYKVGVHKHLEGHDGTWIHDFRGQRQIISNVFEIDEKDYGEVLLEIQKNNPQHLWTRPVFAMPLDEAAVARLPPEHPFDPRPISYYQGLADKSKYLSNEQVLCTHEEANGLGMFAFEQRELAIETGSEQVGAVAISPPSQQTMDEEAQSTQEVSEPSLIPCPPDLRRVGVEYPETLEHLAALREDVWEEDATTVTKVHRKPRQTLFTPTRSVIETKDIVRGISDKRTTMYQFLDSPGQRETLEDNWRSANAHRVLEPSRGSTPARSWTGKTIFQKAASFVGRTMIKASAVCSFFGGANGMGAISTYEPTGRTNVTVGGVCEEVFPAAAGSSAAGAAAGVGHFNETGVDDNGEWIWEVKTSQLRREGDSGGYAVFRMTEFGLTETPPVPKWLKGRIRLRRVVDVMNQTRVCGDLVDDWQKRENQLKSGIPHGKNKYVTVDYFYHLPSSVPQGAPAWMCAAEKVDFQKRKVDPKRGRLSIDRHAASVTIESDSIQYHQIGSGVVKSSVHNAPNATSMLKLPGKLEDVRIFTCRDLQDVPPVIRETARVFPVEEASDLDPAAENGNWRWRPKLTQKKVETGFSSGFQDMVTKSQMEPITSHLKGGKRAILQCSSGVGLSVAVAERLRSSVYGKNGKVYHSSAHLELFIHDLTLCADGFAVRFTDDERQRVDSVLSPTRNMTAEERRKIRLIQEILFYHGKLQPEHKCFEHARSRLRDVSEKALRQLVRVARRDSVARLGLALGVRRKNLGSLTAYESLRSGGVTFLDTTFITEFGFIYSALGGLSVADGRGRHAVSGLKWKLEPFLNRSNLTEEQKQEIRGGVMFNMLDSFAPRLLRNKASPSPEDVARAVHRFLSYMIMRRRIVGDAGLENLGLREWKALDKSGRTMEILPTGKAVYKLERRFLTVKTAHKRLRRLPEFHSMGLQFLLDEIDEMLDHVSTVRLQGRTPAQAFWGLEEAKPELLTHPDDACVRAHDYGNMNIHRLTEARLRIVSELLILQNDKDYVTMVNKIISNVRAQGRLEDDEDWQIGNEVNFYNQKSKADIRVKIIDRQLDESNSAYTYTCHGGGRLITAKKENLSAGVDFDHFLDLPLDTQPITAADYKRGGRLYEKQKQWLQDNFQDGEDFELRAPAHAGTHEPGPFFAFKTPGEGTAKKKRKSKNQPAAEEIDGADYSEEVELSSDEEAGELPEVKEVMNIGSPDDDDVVMRDQANADGLDPMEDDAGYVSLDDDRIWYVVEDCGTAAGLADPCLAASTFVQLEDERNSSKAIPDTWAKPTFTQQHEGLNSSSAVPDMWIEDETTLTCVHESARATLVFPTEIAAAGNGSVADDLEGYRIVNHRSPFDPTFQRTEVADQWRGAQAGANLFEDGRNWIGSTTFFKKPSSIGKKLLSQVEEIAAAVKQEGKNTDDAKDDPMDGSSNSSEALGADFIHTPATRAEKRAVLKLLMGEVEGPIKEDSIAWQVLVSKCFERRDDIQFAPDSMEVLKTWSDERRELANPELQKEIIVSWGWKQVKVVHSKEEFQKAEGQRLLRIVIWDLLPTESREDLGLLSIHDPQTSQHPEVVEKLLGALKFADTDHSFVEDGKGLGVPTLLRKAHVSEWDKLIQGKLLEKWEEGAPCSDEGILTSRAIVDLKMMTRWHYKVAVRVVPGGHNSTISATAESPTLSEIELRLIINCLRQIRGKRILRSGDVPRAFLKNLRFRPDHRPRMKFPFNIRQEHVLRELKARFDVGPGDIFVLNISLYGLKEAALMWFRTLSQFLLSIGFTTSPSSPCVFRRGRCFIGIHVDGLLFSGDEAGFNYFSSAIKKRFGLDKWNDSVDGLVFTGIQIHHDEGKQQVNLSMRQKIEELQPAPMPADEKAPLKEEDITHLKAKRGSLLFIGRTHPEVVLPTRSLAIGHDGEKDGRWTRSQNGIIQRAKMDSPGICMDLSYSEEILAMFPDASFQNPTSTESVGGVEQQETEVTNLHTAFGGGFVRGKEIAEWRRQDERNIYVGRGSKWGNPFKVGRDGNREEVLEKYEAYLRSSGLRSKVGELKGKRLGCFCHPFPCHADILKQAIEEDEVNLLCEPVDEDEVDIEARREFARFYGMEFVGANEEFEEVCTMTEKSATSRRKRKRFAAVDTPSTEKDETSRKAKALRALLGYTFLSISAEDWHRYESKQVAIKRVDTLQEYNKLPVEKIRCSYLGGDSFFSAGVCGSSYDAELRSMGESIPILEMVMAKLRSWGVKTQGILLSDSRSAVLRVVSKSVIAFSDAGVFKTLARVKGSYAEAAWELGSITDKVNPGDGFTKIVTGNKILQFHDILRGEFHLPLGQAYIHRRKYTWERPLAPGATAV